MHNETIRSKARTWRMAATGAALAATFAALGAAGTASAAPTWTATTKADAFFRCVSNCQAGGLGYVANRELIKPATSSDKLRAVGAWERTVHIQCKSLDAQTAYNVTVQDTNWSGTWQTMKFAIKGDVDDTTFPLC